jgi:hypothetical protein
MRKFLKISKEQFKKDFKEDIKKASQKHGLNASAYTRMLLKKDIQELKKRRSW